MGVRAGFGTRFYGSYYAVLPLILRAKVLALGDPPVSPRPSEQLDLHGHPFWKMNTGREQRSHGASVFVNLSGMNFVLG